MESFSSITDPGARSAAYFTQLGKGAVHRSFRQASATPVELRRGPPSGLTAADLRPYPRSADDFQSSQPNWRSLRFDFALNETTAQPRWAQ
jgi:hypothetical protein